MLGHLVKEKTDQAVQILDSLYQHTDDLPYFAEGYFAVVLAYVALRDKTKALTWVKKSMEAREVDQNGLKSEPLF